MHEKSGYDSYTETANIESGPFLSFPLSDALDARWRALFGWGTRPQLFYDQKTGLSTIRPPMPAPVKDKSHKTCTSKGLPGSEDAT